MVIKVSKIQKGFVVLAGLSYIACILGMLLRLDALLCILFLINIGYFVFFERDIFLKYLFFFVMIAWGGLSVFVIDNFKLYLPNLLTFSTYSYAFAPLMIAEETFFVAIFFLEHGNNGEKITKIISSTDNHIRKRPSGSYDLIYKEIIFLAIIISAVFVVEIISKNYYLSGYATRFDYQLNTHVISFSFFGFLPFFIPFFALYSNKKMGTISITVFILFYLSYLILIGQKFTPFFQTLCLLLICYIIPFKYNYIKNNYKKILKCLVVGAGLFIFFSWIQMVIERESIELGSLQLFNRLFNGQGDVWWGIYSRYTGAGIHISEIGDELNALSSSSIGQANYNFGIYKMMRLIAPDPVIQSYASKGARFTNSTNASVYYYFGIWGLILFSLLKAIILHYITNKIILCCVKGEGFMAMVWCFLRDYWISFCFMSAFDLLFRKTPLLFILIVFCSYIVKHRKLYGNSVEVKSRLDERL